MFQRILVPVDGSARAEHAIPIAARLARASGGTLLFVVVEDVSSWLVSVTPPLPQEVFDRQDAELHTYLTALTTRDDMAGLATETKVSTGLVAETLLSVASARQANLIVMTSHGRTGFVRWALGSVAEKLARHSPVPVLILREPIPAALTSGASMGTSGQADQLARPLRVLVPLDGSTLAETALGPAMHLLAALAPPTDRMLHLTRVVSLMTPGGRSLAGILAESSFWREAQEYLTSTAERLCSGELAPSPQVPLQTSLHAPLPTQATWSLTAQIDEASGIVEVAETGMKMEGTALPGGCDLIVLATHGRHGIQRWALGSVAERVLHGTQLPVMLVRPGETK